MNDELLKIGKGVNDVKNSLKKEIEEKKTQTQVQTQTQEPVQEKVPKTQVKDQYDANDEIYYEKNDGNKNIAIFVGYSQEDEELVNLKPTQGGDVFAVNKSNIIGAVMNKKEEEKSKAEEADEILTQEGILSYGKFISLK